MDEHDPWSETINQLSMPDAELEALLNTASVYVCASLADNFDGLNWSKIETSRTTELINRALAAGLEWLMQKLEGRYPPPQHWLVVARASNIILSFLYTQAYGDPHDDA